MIRATFRQLEIFMAVATAGSFSRAAADLDISQVSVSKQIAALEQNLGCILFLRRNGATAQISAEGSELLQKAPQLLSAAGGLPRGSGRKAAHSARQVRVAVGEYLLEAYFYPNLAKFQMLHPDVELELVEMAPSLETVAKLPQLRIDLAYFSLAVQPEDAPGRLLTQIHSHLFATPACKQAWLNGRNHPLPMILPLSGSFFDRSTGMILNKLGIAYRVAARAQRDTVRLSMALEGLGAVCTMTEAAAEAVAQGRLVSLDVPLLPLFCYSFSATSAPPPHVQCVDQFFSPLIQHEPRDWDDPTGNRS